MGYYPFWNISSYRFRKPTTLWSPDFVSVGWFSSLCLYNNHKVSLNKELFLYAHNWFEYVKSLIILSAAAAKSLQLCLTLCDPIDRSPPGCAVPGILQARTVEGVAISFSNPRKWKVKVKSLSHALLLATPWTAAYQAPRSMGFSRQEYWSGVPSSWVNKQLSNS